MSSEECLPRCAEVTFSTARGTALSCSRGRRPVRLTELSLQVQGGLAARAAPWAGWEAEVETGVASPREDRGDPGETPPAGASSTELVTGSVPIREYPTSPASSTHGGSSTSAWQLCGHSTW